MTTGVQDEVPSMTAPLLATDRCSSCGAQAYVRVTLAGFPLELCKHHFQEHELALMAQGAVILIDDRKSLDPA